MTEQERKELKELRELRESLYDQIRWERDVAIKQLEDIGLGLGEKTDKVKEALEKQIPKKPKTEPFYGGRCIVCNALIPNKSINYCHECGQKLDWGE